jgi:hypothetical protein
MMKDLQAPFHPDDIEWRVGATNQDKTSGIALAYVTNRAIQNRLDEIFGPFGWKNEFREWKQGSQLCGLSIKFGDEWITKWDGADDSNQEATKGGLSDAMKRAGYQWGIGRYLYKLENTWVQIKAQGKSYALVNEPKLPEWALPEGFQYTNEPQKNNQQATNPSNNPSANQNDVFSKPASEKQIGLVHKLLEDLEGLGSNYDAVITELKKQIGSFNKIEELTIPQASNAITVLKQWVDKKRNKGA